MHAFFFFFAFANGNVVLEKLAYLQNKNGFEHVLHVNYPKRNNGGFVGHTFKTDKSWSWILFHKCLLSLMSVLIVNEEI